MIWLKMFSTNTNSTDVYTVNLFNSDPSGG